MKNIFLLLLGIRFSFCLLAQSPVALQLPTGFTAQAVALNQGRVRHIAIAPNGTLYLKLERLRNGAGIVRLRDLNQDGVYEDSLLFGNYIGTGIALKNNFLYASSNNAIFRYALDRNYEPLQPEKPERLVYGLVDKGQHASKSITLDNAGNI